MARALARIERKVQLNAVLRGAGLVTTDRAGLDGLLGLTMTMAAGRDLLPPPRLARH